MDPFVPTMNESKNDVDPIANEEIQDVEAEKSLDVVDSSMKDKGKVNVDKYIPKNILRP